MLVAVVVATCFVAAFLMLLGAQITTQIHSLVQELPGLLESLGDQLGVLDLGHTVAARVQAFFSKGETVLSVAGLTLSVFDVLLSTALVIIAGIYIALRPSTYRSGFLIL